MHMHQSFIVSNLVLCQTSVTLSIASKICVSELLLLPIQVLRFEDHPTPCLAVTFAPWDPQLLIFAEDSARVYIKGAQHMLVMSPTGFV